MEWPPWPIAYNKLKTSSAPVSHLHRPYQTGKKPVRLNPRRHAAFCLGCRWSGIPPLPAVFLRLSLERTIVFSVSGIIPPEINFVLRWHLPAPQMGDKMCVAGRRQYNELFIKAALHIHSNVHPTPGEVRAQAGTRHCTDRWERMGPSTDLH